MFVWREAWGRLESVPRRRRNAGLHRTVKYHGKDFWSLDPAPSVVENVLGQLTESRGTNEDRR
jgi:hypothetical protein